MRPMTVVQAGKAALAIGAVLSSTAACERPKASSDRQAVTDGMYRIVRFVQTGHRDEYMKAMDETLANLGPRAAPTLIEILGHEKNTAVSGWAAMYLYRYPGKATDEALLTGIDPRRGYDVVYACSEVLGVRIIEGNLAIPKDTVQRAALKCLPECRGRNLRSIVTLLVDCGSREGETALVRELSKRKKEPYARLSIARGLWDIGSGPTKGIARSEVALLRKDGHQEQSKILADYLAGIK